MKILMLSLGLSVLIATIAVFFLVLINVAGLAVVLETTAYVVVISGGIGAGFYLIKRGIE